MTLKNSLRLLGMLALVVAAWSSKAPTASQDDGALKEQLRLARAEGIPTSGDEFKATIPSALPKDNAALLYHRLMSHSAAERLNLDSLANQILFHPEPEHLSNGRAELAKHKKDLLLIEVAASLPRCWFDRNRSEGPAVLMPEFATIKWAARLLVVRSALEVSQGDSRSAQQDANRILLIAGQAGEEPIELADLVGRFIFLMGLKTITGLAFSHRNVPGYRQALTKMLASFPRPDLKKEHRADLYDLLWLMGHSDTEGWRRLGLREDPHVAVRVLGALMNRSRAKVEVVKEMRAYWAALDLPLAERGKQLNLASGALVVDLMAFPGAADLYQYLILCESGSPERENIWEAHRVAEIAIARALGTPELSGQRATAGLTSPFDGKPLTYHFDGRRIVVEVSRQSSNPLQVNIPPDTLAERRPAL